MLLKIDILELVLIILSFYCLGFKLFVLIDCKFVIVVRIISKFLGINDWFFEGKKIVLFLDLF